MINLELLKPANFLIIGLMSLAFALLIDRVHDSIVFTNKKDSENA